MPFGFLIAFWFFLFILDCSALAGRSLLFPVTKQIKFPASKSPGSCGERGCSAATVRATGKNPGRRQQVCSMPRGGLRLLLSLLDYHSFPGFELFDSGKAVKYSKTSAWEPSFHLTAASPGTPAEPKGCHHSITPEGYFQIFCSEQGKLAAKACFPLFCPFCVIFFFFRPGTRFHDRRSRVRCIFVERYAAF